MNAMVERRRQYNRRLNTSDDGKYEKSREIRVIVPANALQDIQVFIIHCLNLFRII